MDKPVQPTQREVYMLWFTRDRDEDPEIEIIVGMYETEADAQAAMRLRVDKPGFRDFPDGFHIDSWTLGQSSWDDGFVVDAATVAPEVPTDKIRAPKLGSQKRT
jgi:hypothetical protein